ncbi:ABC transporter substrate-binding protein [Mesobacterium pallidum]|uniref:ABC transporter substrate-binding protein n=1 Tax=Mesobacterium pallidum TaxID=2872037 RepID=UPI001EE195A0|nr:ABC transporter substrate-binding protein [Mesobacterium pallidum]
MKRASRLLGAIALGLSAAQPLRAEVAVTLHFLKIDVPAPPTLTSLDVVPEGLGLDGAALAVADNTTTGRFLGQTYRLEQSEVDVDGDVTGAARAALAQTPYLVIDGPAEALLAIADLPEAQGAILFNASAPDAALRSGDCRANLLHTAPSDAMRTDAIAQYLVVRKWTDAVMIVGPHPADKAFAAAMERSLAKFGARLRETKTWGESGADMRRNAAEEVPLFTADFPGHDVVIVADELHDFGRFIPYNTQEPRPVVGSEGLRAEAWAPVVEQWGAAQLQSRFQDHAGRPMEPGDYAAWAAVRAVGEAVTRTGTGDSDSVYAYMTGPEFELAGFKGRPLSFRPWNGQLRQTIPLVHDRALAASAPFEGFLHPVTELDTLGLDRPESACTAFEE